MGTYDSNRLKAVRNVIVKEHWFSRSKHYDCNLHALHGHQHSNIESVLPDEPFELQEYVSAL